MWFVYIGMMDSTVYQSNVHNDLHTGNYGKPSGS